MTKCDLKDDIQVSNEEATALSSKYGIKYVETSVNSDVNAELAFMEAVPHDQAGVVEKKKCNIQ